VVAVIALAYHLFHGFHSAFKTLGVHNYKYLRMLESFGYGFTIIVCLLFALMPVSMLLHWVSPY
jgi:succinate dehydrogenase / fumarate reductase cytochrome b subunit